jgi:SulP family sulfate permease
VEQGIGVAVGLAILDRTRLTARPTVHVMGRISDTTSWAPLTAPERPTEVPGVLVVLFAAPLWYANAAHFRAGLDHARHRSDPAPRLIVLDAVGMYDIDFTGARTLSQVLDGLAQEGTAFAVARAGDHLKRNLERGGLLLRIGRDHFYPSVDEAVRSAAATPRHGRA